MNLYTRTHGLFLIVIFLLSWVQKPVNQHNEPNGKNGTSLSEVMKDTTVYSLDTTNGIIFHYIDLYQAILPMY